MQSVHKMRPIASSALCLYVCLSVSHVRAKKAKPIEMPIKGLTWVDPRNHLLDGVDPKGRGNFGGCLAQ